MKKRGFNHPMRSGQIEKVEHEYERHVTQVLTANVEVATGNVIAPTVSDTRKKVDFAAHIEQTVTTDPNAEWVIICDQLHTHKSETLVKLIAQVCGITNNLDKRRAQEF